MLHAGQTDNSDVCTQQHTGELRHYWSFYHSMSWALLYRLADSEAAAMAGCKYAEDFDGLQYSGRGELVSEFQAQNSSVDLRSEWHYCSSCCHCLCRDQNLVNCSDGRQSHLTLEMTSSLRQALVTVLLLTQYVLMADYSVVMHLTSWLPMFSCNQHVHLLPTEVAAAAAAAANHLVCVSDIVCPCNNHHLNMKYTPITHIHKVVKLVSAFSYLLLFNACKLINVK